MEETDYNSVLLTTDMGTGCTLSGVSINGITVDWIAADCRIQADGEVVGYPCSFKVEPDNVEIQVDPDGSRYILFLNEGKRLKVEQASNIGDKVYFFFNADQLEIKTC